MVDGDALFEVRAEQPDPRSRLWNWAIYRSGAPTPAQRSQPLFTTDAEAIDAGGLAVAAMQRRAMQSSFFKPSA